MIFTIKNTTGDTATTAIIEKIVGLFVGKATVIGKVFAAFSGSDSTSKNKKNQGSIVTIKSSSKDSVSFTLNDSTVYYAVRYAQIGDMKYEKTFWGKISAPECAIDPTAPAYPFKLSNNQTIFSLIGNKCDMPKDLLKVNLNYDHGNVYVVVTDQQKNTGATTRRGAVAKKPIIDTLYNTGPIDFSNEYLGRTYSDSFQFVANRNATKQGSTNDVIVADFEFTFDPEKKNGVITNYQNYYHTCIYTMHSTIKYFPK